MENDIHVWEQIRKNNMESFTDLYKKYYQVLFAFGYSMSGDKELIKDCLHEMLLEIWQNRNALPTVKNVSGYLKSYLKHKILRVNARQLKFTENEPGDNHLHGVQLPYETLLVQLQTTQELKEKVQRAIDCLTKKQMEVIRMRFFEKMSYDEIANITSTTARTVYNQVYESLKILRQKLSRL